MDSYSFSTGVRVRFAETDAQGIAHNSSFVVWFEVARVEYLREFAGGYQKLRDLGIEALVLETHVRHHQPAFFDEQLVINARCGEVRGARFRFDYEVLRDGAVVVDGWTQHACVDAQTLRPTRVPDWLTDALASAESPSARSTPSAS